MSIGSILATRMIMLVPREILLTESFSLCDELGAKKSVLVTGAGGFIGSHLTERLVELGAKLRALVHYNALGHWGWLSDSSRKAEIEVLAGDIADRDSMRRATKDVDIVFHLAALISIPYSY